MSKERSRAGTGLSLWELVSIGVGGMVGGGIFAVLGLSVQLSGGGAPVAFAIAGLIALLTAMSYARLSAALPSRGGTATFLNCSFGTGLFAGGLNVLLWLSYVIMLALYSSAFGAYFAGFFSTSGVRTAATAGVILLFTALNAINASAVGRAEEIIVAIKVLILVSFAALAFATIDPGRLAPGSWTSPLGIVGGGMVIFLAYEGFELIANAAEDVEDRRRSLPKAFLVSVILVIVIYVLIAAVTVGTLTPAEIAAASDFVLAEAARPLLGQLGFTIIAIAALLSTGSAINATLYGSARLTYSLARSGELPEGLDHQVGGKPIEGLLVTAALALTAAVSLDLSRIATLGSAGFLLVFAAVNIANYRLRSKTGSRPWLPLTAASACLLALGALLIEIGGRDLVAVAIVAGLVLGSFLAEAVYRRFSGRVIRSLLPADAGEDGGT